LFDGEVDSLVGVEGGAADGGCDSRDVVKYIRIVSGTSGIISISQTLPSARVTTPPLTSLQALPVAEGYDNSNVARQIRRIVSPELISSGKLLHVKTVDLPIEETQIREHPTSGHLRAKA
jgi:hypothetical protein